MKKMVAPSRGRGLKHYARCAEHATCDVAPSRGRGLKHKNNGEKK